MFNNINCYWNLLLIERNPIAAARSFQSWRAGVTQVWSLSGQLFPNKK